MVDGELSVELHPLDEERHVVELVRLEVLEHVREPPELMPMPEEIFIPELKVSRKYFWCYSFKILRQSQALVK